MPMQKALISVIINTKNEEVNLPRLLKSIDGWVDEIIVCDMHSSDKTVEIAKHFNCKVMMHDDVGYVEPARKAAVDAACHDWILLLDADELVNNQLKQWIFDNLFQQSHFAFDGVELPFIQYMSGKEIKYSDFGTQKHLRLFKKSKYQFSDKIHSRRVATGNPQVLSLSASQGALLHFNCGSFKKFLDKINHYAYIEAGEIIKERGDYQFSFLKGVYAFIGKFFAYYVKNKGYKDGLHGLHISLCMGLYSFLVRSYAYEIANMGSEDAIQKNYDIVGQKHY